MRITFTVDRHTRYINILEAMAKDVTGIRSSRICAMLVKGNNVLSFGVNQKKTHPMQKIHSKNPLAQSLHAEVHAIVNALRDHSKKDLRGSVLYIARVKYTTGRKDSSRGLSFPCKGCLSAISKYGIKTVYFTEDSGGIGKVEFL